MNVVLISNMKGLFELYINFLSLAMERKQAADFPESYELTS